MTTNDAEDKDVRVARQPVVAASHIATGSPDVEMVGENEGMKIEKAKETDHSSDKDMVSEHHGEVVNVEEQPEDMKINDVLEVDIRDMETGMAADGLQGSLEDCDLDIPKLDLNNIDLETLKVEHQKLLDMLKKSKAETDKRIKSRKAMQDKTMMVEGWMDDHLDHLDTNVDPESLENTDAAETPIQDAEGSGELEGSVTYTRDSSRERRPDELEDDTFLTGAFLGKAERPMPPAPIRSSKSPSSVKISTPEPDVMDQSALPATERCSSSTSPPSQDSQSPTLSESESLITVKEVAPLCKLTGSSGSPVSVTSSAESFATAPSDLEACSKGEQNTSMTADTSTDSYSTAENELQIEKVVHSKSPQAASDDSKYQTRKTVPLKAIETVCPMQEENRVLDTIPDVQLASVPDTSDVTPDSFQMAAPGTSETLDVSDYDIPSNDSSRLSAYGIYLDTSLESNSESIHSPVWTGFIPPEPTMIQCNVDLYDSPVVEDVILKTDAPERVEAGTGIDAMIAQVFSDGEKFDFSTPSDYVIGNEALSNEERLRQLELIIKQQDELASLARDGGSRADSGEPRDSAVTGKMCR